MINFFRVTKIHRPILLILGVISFGTVGYVYLESYRLLDAFYMTIITVGTVGFTEVQPLSDIGRLFTSVLILTTLGVFAYSITLISHSFVEGDARRDPLPAGMDVALFKSVLHDWPEDGARHLLDAAAKALKPGGQIVIFERLPFELERHLGYHEISNLMFLHHLRKPDFYRARLAATGFDIVAEAQIELDMPFFLLAGKKV